MSDAKPIIEFLKDKPKYLSLVNKEIPAFTTGKDYNKWTYPAAKLHDTDICLASLTANNPESVNITYLDDTHKTQYVIVPNSFLASILPPEKYAEMEQKYAVARERNELRSKLNLNTSVGSDPEMFVVDKNDQVIPAFTFLPSKDEPIKAEVHGHWRPNNIYWDGFQAEFDTMENSCLSGQVDSIHFGLQGLLKAAREHDKDAKLSFRTVVDIPPDMMAEARPEHVQFGCMPSFNAYGMKGESTPGHEVPFRPAGGHMHFAFSLKHDEAIKIVKAMDAILGVACVSLFASFDDPRRRKLYGLAGEYRLPPHGLEYRVLSNAWLMHPLLAHIVFDIGRTAAMVGKKDMLSKWECSESETIRIINECDVEAARKVLTHNAEFLKRIIEVKYMNWWTSGPNVDAVKAAEYVYNAIMNGAESIIKEPTNIEANWNLLGAKSTVKGKELDNSAYANSTLDSTWRMHSDGPGKNVMFVFKHGLENEKV